MNTSSLCPRSLALLTLTVAATAAQAQYTSSLPTYYQTPTTQLSSIHTGGSLLTLSATPADITVAGQFQVTVPATPTTGPAVSGTLVQWMVDRPLANNQTLSNFVTTTKLDGFSQPPGGSVVGTTFGTLRTYIADTSNNTMLGSSLSFIPLSLNFGAANWFPPITSSSAPFTVNIPATGSYALRQVLDLDGVYFSGPGGTWIVDVPAMSSLAAVPEPGSAALWLLGLAAVLFCKTIRREQP